MSAWGSCGGAGPWPSVLQKMQKPWLCHSSLILCNFHTQVYSISHSFWRLTKSMTPKKILSSHLIPGCFSIWSRNKNKPNYNSWKRRVTIWLVLPIDRAKCKREHVIRFETHNILKGGLFSYIISLCPKADWGNKNCRKLVSILLKFQGWKQNLLSSPQSALNIKSHFCLTSWLKDF